MRFACWVTKFTVEHSEFVILIDLALQKMLSQTRCNITLYVHNLPLFYKYDKEFFNYLKLS